MEQPIAGYLARRLAQSILVILIVLTGVFVLIRLGGDPTLLYVRPDATPADVALMRHLLGFDRPLPEQYVEFIQHAVQGDFGTSFREGRPALSAVLERIPATLSLTLFALALMVVIAVPIGMIAAIRRNSMYDVVGMAVAVAGQSMPTFWLGIVLILLFSVTLRWIPAFGAEGFKALILPGITLAVYTAAITSRLTRSSMVEVLTSEYIRTARAKGLTEQVVQIRHALRNAVIPVITVIGLQFGNLMGGTLVTEQVFSYPGMGRLAVQAILNRDMSVVQAFVIVTAVIIVLVNLLVDLAYSWLDPRIRTA